MSPSGALEAIRIVCGVEGEAYVRHAAAMLHSVVSASGEDPIHVDYLHGEDTSARGRRRLGAMVEDLGATIAYHHVPDGWVTGLPIKGFTRKATWYRIFLTRLLPEATRAVWLDLDLLVLDSLRALWETSLDGHLVGAVTNVPPGPERTVLRPDLGGDRYFNAGVLLFDLEAMRREGTDEQLRSYAVANAARLALRDQDALNAVLQGRRFPLHPRWNCMNSIWSWDYACEYLDREQVLEARRSPAIRHFEGPSYNKPWHLLCDAESYRQYRQHRKETPWPHVRRTGRTPINLLRHARRQLPGLRPS